MLKPMPTCRQSTLISVLTTARFYWVIAVLLFGCFLILEMLMFWGQSTGTTEEHFIQLMSWRWIVLLLLSICAATGIIIHLKQQTAALRQTALISNEQHTPVLRVNREGILVYANPASSILLNHWEITESGRLPEKYIQIVDTVMQSGTKASAEVDMPNYSCMLEFVPFIELGYVNIYGSDITERKRSEEEMLHLINHDSVTELPNRILFKELLEHSLNFTKENGQLLALYLFNINDFREINDALGHRCGDQLLQTVAIRLRARLPERVTLARLQGNDFAIFYTGLKDISQAAELAQGLVRLFLDPFDIADQKITLSICMGISIYPLDSNDQSQLMRNCDLALFRARAKGRNIFQFYVAGMNDDLEIKRKMMLEIRHALQRKQLSLLFQPQIEIPTRKIISAETLLRWEHPEYGWVLPGEFISLAESSGAITAIGEWVLQRACQECARWHREGYREVGIAVNLSAVQFRQADILAIVTKALHNADLEPSYLELEITETIVMENAEEAIIIMKDLKELGVFLSIDDFGTGYSSLSYLSRFPIDRIKIDRSFIHSIDKSDHKSAIVKTVIELAHHLNVHVLAEGVERQEELQVLKNLKCDEAQGFYFSRPLHSSDIPIYLSKRGVIRHLGNM